MSTHGEGLSLQRDAACLSELSVLSKNCLLSMAYGCISAVTALRSCLAVPARSKRLSFRYRGLLNQDPARYAIRRLLMDRSDPMLLSRYTRAARSLLGTLSGPPQHRVVFIHVPRCGGVSVSDALVERYGVAALLRVRSVGIDPASSKRSADLLSIDVQTYRRNVLAYYMALPYLRYIHGHIWFRRGLYEHYAGEWSFATLLRHPIDRWFSAYFYNRYKAGSHCKVELELEDYVGARVGTETGSTYARYFGSLDGDDCSVDQAIANAKANLACFSVVGILEDLPRLARAFRTSLGIRLRIGHRNRSPAPLATRRAVSSSVQRRVRRLCEPDVEVYHWVREHLRDGRVS